MAYVLRRLTSTRLQKAEDIYEAKGCKYIKDQSMLKAFLKGWSANDRLLQYRDSGKPLTHPSCATLIFGRRMEGCMEIYYNIYVNIVTTSGVACAVNISI